MKTKIITNQKQIDIDAHFKYRCPSCAYDFWISINEARTKNFKIVCDCGVVFMPQRIKKIKVIYTNNTPIKPKKKPEKTREKETKQIDEDILNKSTQILVKYGFTKTESENILKKAYDKCPTTDLSQLIKQALKLVGETHE